MPIAAVEWNAGTMWGSHNSLSGKSETWVESLLGKSAKQKKQQK